jgi:site-specific DNA recombinase
MAAGAAASASAWVPLPNLLKNRFYIGEITYRGEVHHGEHEPILTRDLCITARRTLRCRRQCFAVAS